MVSRKNALSQKPENSDATDGSSESVKALDSALAKWRSEASSPLLKREYDKGKAFERLCGIFLTHDPVQSMQYESPVPWEQWAEQHGLLKIDTGVDLVAKLRNEDGWCAIQCKFYAEERTILKAEIDSFLSASGSKHFRRRLIIDTTGRGWSRNAEDAWEYEVNGKAALKWVMERQCVSMDGKSGIVNDANIYATETAGDPSYLLKLLAQVIRVSIETTGIIKSLPDPKWRGVDP